MAIATVNPATGARVQGFEALDATGIEEKVARASAAARSWAAMPLAQRVQVVRRAADLLDRDRERYAALMTLEMGKLLSAARDEAAKCATTARWYCDEAERLVGPERVEVEGERSYVLYQPLGVVLAVMPWNFPFWQVLRFAAPALVAGNVVLLKHASNVPQCAMALESLFTDAGAPPGVFQALLVGSDAVSALLEDPRVAAATLTGSEGAGRSVAATAGAQLKKTVLELGGSDPFIVMPSADMERAVATAVRARTINNGQSCIAAKRFIVHAEVFDRFVAAFVPAMRNLRVGDPMEASTQVGPLATAAQREEVAAQVAATVAAGARVLTGGKGLERQGFYFEPTVLVDVPPHSPAARDEIFGPVASIFPARDAAHAIEIANGTRFGLGSSVWTRDLEEAELFARHIEAGTVFVNGMVASDARFPFGGIKASGYGRELSALGLREFTNVKTVRISLEGMEADTRAE